MKKLYFLFFLVIGFVTQAQNVYIPDANFKAKLLAASPSNSIASTDTPVFNATNNTWSVSSYHTIDTNGDGQIQVSEAQAIKYLSIGNANITNLNGIQEFNNLLYLNCGGNQVSSLNTTGFTNLLFLNCVFNQISSLNTTGFTNLVELKCSNNYSLSSLDFSNLINLKLLECKGTLIDVSNLQSTSLELLLCGNYISPGLNILTTSIDISGLPNLKTFTCSDTNNIVSLDFSGMTNLEYIYVNGNLSLTSLDVSNCTNLEYLDCRFNQLTTLNIKGNNFTWNTGSAVTFAQQPFLFYDNPNLEYICADEDDLTVLQQLINFYGYFAICHVNTYCSFTPGGVFYEIEGQTKFDSNSNGCDANDIDYPNLKCNITDGTNNGSFIADTSGSYYMPVGAGIHTVTPVLENPTYFTISPSNFTVDFPTQASPFTQDFCVTKTGVYSDVEIAIIPTTPARPGFDATYKLVFRNKGTEVENGSVTLTYDDSVLDYVQSNPVYNSSATNSYTWNYTNLQPFESRAITIEFNVNSPMETPAVNNGDVLVYAATITTQNTDETPADNTTTLNQTVVGSYDPNDKTCIEGETINPAMIGEYVHYVIRFENTGTYPAENIVVRDDIDPTQFDIATLVPLSGSHEFYTRINGNKVEFIFENINLDFNNTTNDGYVAFKIKSLPTLTVNSTISNTAKIYFDYNYPIVTNTATSTYQVLNAQSFDFDSAFTMYPNPAKEVLNLQAKSGITIQSIEIYNIVGQVVLALPNAGKTIDVSSLESGSYFIKINTDNGSTSTKFIKE